MRLAEVSRSWATAYRALARHLTAALGGLAVAAEHVGSTAVPGLPAKPIIDVAVGLRPHASRPEVIARLEAGGYRFRGDQGDEGGLLFVREDGPERRVAHVHAVGHGDEQWRAYLAFRDLLRADPATRDAYAALKRRLAARHPDDRGAYTSGKTPFIAAALARGVPGYAE